MTTELDALCDDYLTFCAVRRGRRPLTIRTYTKSLSDFVEWLDGTNIETLTPDDLEAFGWRPLRNGGTPAAATVRREIVAVKRFCEYLVARRGFNLRCHLDVVSPPVPDRSPNPISDDAWRTLWASDMPVDDRLWLGDAYWLGRRRYEIVTTAPAGVLVETRQLSFIRKGGKERRIEYANPIEMVERTLPWVTEGWRDWVALLESTAKQREGEKHLCVHSFADDPFLDGNRITKRLHTMCKRAGLDPFGPHRLRHSACTNMFRAGIDHAAIQEHMGHTSFDTTRGYMSVAGWFQQALDKGREK